jgi:hypothetical protein
LRYQAKANYTGDKKDEQKALREITSVICGVEFFLVVILVEQPAG